MRINEKKYLKKKREYMKRSILIMALTVCSLFNVTKPMNPEGLPTEIKAYVVSMLRDPSIETIIKSLIALKRTNQEFYAVVYDIPLAQLFLELGQLVVNDNIFAVFDFLKQHPALLQHQDLAKYLHNKFNYLSEQNIQNGLALLDPVIAEEYKQMLNASIDKFRTILKENFAYDQKEIANLEQQLNNPIDGMFFVSLYNNDLDSAFLLMVLGANVNLIGPQQITPLSWAISKENYLLMKLLCQAGADVNKGDYLNSLVQQRKLEYIKLLLNCGAKVDSESIMDAPIFSAALKRDTAIINLLLKYNADISKTFFENGKKEILKIWIKDEDYKKGLLNALDFLKNYISSVRQEKAGFLSRRPRIEPRGFGGL